MNAKNSLKLSRQGSSGLKKSDSTLQDVFSICNVSKNSQQNTNRVQSSKYFSLMYSPDYTIVRGKLSKYLRGGDGERIKLIISYPLNFLSYYCFLDPLLTFTFSSDDQSHKQIFVFWSEYLESVAEWAPPSVSTRNNIIESSNLRSESQDIVLRSLRAQGVSHMSVFSSYTMWFTKLQLSIFYEQVVEYC